ncbi:MAG: hypothetical protein AAF074_09230 [Pseudomonadota bacterium]
MAGGVCPEPSAALIFHSCWGQGSAQLLLLPEDLPLPEPDDLSLSLLVTGGYTGRVPRNEGRPAPVGLMIRKGEVVGRNIARMDGILVLGPEPGALRLERRSSVDLDGRRYDLSPLEQRSAFIAAASAAGLSVVQSHLLVIDGKADTRAVEDAPRSRRRILFTDAAGFGVWQSRGPLTLDAAARRLVSERAPLMALNLDMGSYDFCLRRRAGQAAERCGALTPQQIDGKLSSVILLNLR